MRRMIWYGLAGALIGYLLMHPFAMLAYTLGPPHPHTTLGFSLWGHQVRFSFGPEMLIMGGAFALMGGAAGFLLGAWSLQQERLAAAKWESQRRLAALETLQALMVTLAHYIRNANLVIGGFSARLAKTASSPEWQEQLRLIQQASRDIDAVIASLQNLTEITTSQYLADGQTRMIDLKKELEARLASEDRHGF